MSTQNNITARAWADLLLLSLIWGAIFLFISIALREMTPLWIVFHRVFWAMLVLWLYVLWRGFDVPRTGRIWLAFLVMGTLNNAIPFTLITWGQTQIESGLASILNATTAFFGISVAAVFLPDERLTANRITGVLIGVAGVVLIIGPEALSGLDPRALGQIAILGATLSYAFAGVWAKKRMKGLAPSVSAAGMLTGSACLMLPLAWAIEGAPQGGLSFTTVTALAYCALIGTVCAYLLYYRILAAAGSGNLMLCTIMMPPISIFLGAIVLGERLSPTTYGGLALIAFGLLVLDGRAFAWFNRAKASSTTEHR